MPHVNRWLSASVGSVPQMCKTFEPISEDCRWAPGGAAGAAGAAGGEGGPAAAWNTTTTASGTHEFDLRAGLASLGVLMGTITNDIVAPDTVQLSTVRLYSDRLKAWHAGLPESLTLSNAVRESKQSVDAPAKTSTLLIHCAYLSSIILLTRRLLVEKISVSVTGIPCPQSSNSDTGATDTADEFSEMCVSAARQLATVVGLLRAENKLARRCWIVIQSAYTAGIIVSLDVSFYRGRPMLESAFKESLELISKCILTLQCCAAFDLVAERYARILQPIQLMLSTPEPTAAVKRARIFRDPFSSSNPQQQQQQHPNDHSSSPYTMDGFMSNENMLEHIMNLVKTPYGGEAEIIDQDFFFSSGPAGKGFPENYRFLYTGEPRISNNHNHTASETNRFNRAAEANGRKYPYRTKEEYEEFFRRAV